MTSRLAIPRVIGVGGVAAVMAVLALGSLSARAETERERYTAFAVDMGFPGRTTAGQVEFVIERYSTDEERDRLMAVLVEKGPEKLLDTLQSLPRVGYFRTPNSIGYDIKFARKHKGEDGGEVIHDDDRPLHRLLGSREPAADHRLSVHPHRDPHGPRWRGRRQDVDCHQASTYDKKNNTIVLEDYKSQPVILNQVKSEAVS